MLLTRCKMCWLFMAKHPALPTMNFFSSIIFVNSFDNADNSFHLHLKSIDPCLIFRAEFKNTIKLLEHTDGDAYYHKTNNH